MLNPYESSQLDAEPPKPLPPRNEELREWLGITPADGLLYLAVAALAGMYALSDRTADIALAVVALVLTLASCPIGMKRDPALSGFTNFMKLVSYPLGVLLAVGAIVVHYVWFNK